jgi:hypothetical protein
MWQQWSWPGSSWFHLFPWLKSALKGRRFCDATDIIQNAMEELKRLLQNCTRGLFWRKCSLNDTVLDLSELKWFREHFETTRWFVFYTS